VFVVLPVSVYPLRTAGRSAI